MPHDGTAEAPSKFRAIAFITEELGKFSPLFLGGFTHAWGVNSQYAPPQRRSMTMVSVSRAKYDAKM